MNLTILATKLKKAGFKVKIKQQTMGKSLVATKNKLNISRYLLANQKK